MAFENEAKYKKLRRFKRSTIFGRVGFLYSNKYLFANLVTISEGGMMFDCDLPLEPGILIKTYFSIQGEFIDVNSVVLYKFAPKSDSEKNSYMIGLKFDDLSRQHQTVIQKYVLDHAD